MCKIPLFMKPCSLSRKYFYGFFLFSIQLFFFLPSIAQISNDDCANAITLTPGLSCSPTAGTLRDAVLGAATQTAGISVACGNNSSPDVWYKFVAQSTRPTIRLTGMGSRMDDNPRLQIFTTDQCAVATLNATPMTCASAVSAGNLNLISSTALTVGTTYLVRVLINGASVAGGAAADWNFGICVIDAPFNDLCGNATT
jgi:hypothetical protein